MLENQQYDKKSLSFLIGKNTDWDELQRMPFALPTHPVL